MLINYNSPNYTLTIPQYNIKLFNNTYNFTIKKSYIVKMSNKDNYQLVIVYNLEYINEKNENFTCTIPYYLSDGHTNGINGNFLLPFLCFSHKHSAKCPRLINKPFGTSNLLLKYVTYRNLGLDNIKNFIFKPNQNLDSKQIIQNIFNIDLNDYYGHTTNIGLGSFLKRFSNILDLFISIVGNVKLNKIDNITNPEFNYIPNVNIINLNKFIIHPNYNIENDTDVFNLLKTQLIQQFILNYIHTKNNQPSEENINNYINTNLVKCSSKYRIDIINYLNDLKQNFILSLNQNMKINYITVIKNEKDIITDLDFNKIISICDGDNIDPHSENNYNSYNIISQSFLTDLLNHVNINSINNSHILLNEILTNAENYLFKYNINFEKSIKQSWNSQCIL